MSTLYVVACSAKKSRILMEGEPMQAQEAYRGQAFLMAREILRRQRLKWCVLSGWHGFLWPHTVIEAYDVKMTPLKDAADWPDCFYRLSDREYGRLRTASRVVVVGSKLYSDAAELLLGRPVEAPLRGLPIGKMLSKIHLKEWL